MYPPPPQISHNLAYCLHLIVDDGEAILEREGVEEDEAADSPGGGAVALLVGGGDDFGDAARGAGVAGELLGGLIERVADGCDGLDHLIVDLVREEAQMVGEGGE